MALSGVRSSWLIVARKSRLGRLAASARGRAGGAARSASCAGMRYWRCTIALRGAARARPPISAKLARWPAQPVQLRRRLGAAHRQGRAGRAGPRACTPPAPRARAGRPSLPRAKLPAVVAEQASAAGDRLARVARPVARCWRRRALDERAERLSIAPVIGESGHGEQALRASHIGGGREVDRAPRRRLAQVVEVAPRARRAARPAARRGGRRPRAPAAPAAPPPRRGSIRPNPSSAPGSAASTCPGRASSPSGAPGGPASAPTRARGRGLPRGPSPDLQREPCARNSRARAPGGHVAGPA